LAAALLVYEEYVHWLGFPDGRITELGYAERRLAYEFIGVSVVVGLYSVYLGAAGGRKGIGRRLGGVTVLYVVVGIVMLLLDQYYRAHLDNGVGG
jgi:sorbitol-specific phosphotransferase system component IIC